MLGSINLTQYVLHPFTDKASFNFPKFTKDVYIFNRMLDNVVDISNLPLEIQRNELRRKRRHGIGFLGIGSMFNMMKLRYGSDESIELTRKISKSMAEVSIQAGIDLAKEKGPAPIMNEIFVIDQALISKNPKILNYYKIGDVVSGKELLVLSDYMQRFPEETLNEIKEFGMRYSHATSIAPTGTMALGIGNNCCVAKGTSIKTSNGDILIENIDIAKDKVLTYIPSKDKFEYKEIEFCGITRPNTEVLEIELENGTTLKVTPDHKILIKNIKTNKLEYVEAQYINIYESEIVSIEPSNKCQFCNKEFINRRAMIAHISKTHKIPTLEYQYQYENSNKCSVCHKHMTLDEVKSRFRYGKQVKDQTCSDECSFDAKIQNEQYFMKFYEIPFKEAREIFLKKYEDRASLPSQLEYWTRKGFSLENAKLKVSEFQNKVSLNAFITKYGEVEGSQKYKDFCETKSIQYSGNNNPMYGKVLTEEEKSNISKGIKNSINNIVTIENIVNAKNTSKNIEKSAIIGIRENVIWDILKDLNINYSTQFHVIVPIQFKSKIENNYIIYDILLSDYNCILELNESHYTYKKQRLIDNIRSEIAIFLGYKFNEVWLTEELDIKNQLINIISKFNRAVA